MKYTVFLLLVLACRPSKPVTTLTVDGKLSNQLQDGKYLIANTPGDDKGATSFLGSSATNVRGK